jgi:hypothetical protein
LKLLELCISLLKEWQKHQFLLEMAKDEKSGMELASEHKCRNFMRCLRERGEIVLKTPRNMKHPPLTFLHESDHPQSPP